MNKSNIQSVSAKHTKTLFGHPAGLYVLFLTEMWERFSYYGMRALLVLYMTKHLILAAQSNLHVFGFGGLQSILESVFGHLEVQPLSSQIYGLYTAFVYLTPLAGGWLADRVLGQRKTVILGGLIMALGHFLMAMESMFLVALLLLIIGNGCFKPNISTQVGSLYPEGDPRRDRAYTIFYMGVNLGAFFSPLVCGTLGQVYGWHYGFGAAGVGMLIGLMVYIFGQPYLAEARARQTKEIVKEEHQPLTKQQRAAIWGLVVLLIPNTLFWAIYEQQGNTLQLFADSNVDWHFMGWQMPSTWFQSVNAFFIFALAPFLNFFWGWQNGKGREPGSVIKMALGCCILGLSFLVLMGITHGMKQETMFSFLWLVACTFIYTVGELYLSPVGLSLVSKVAPARLVGLLMGAWFLPMFAGNYLAGYIGMFYNRMPRDMFFLMLTGLGLLAGLSIFLLQGPLKKAVGHNV